MMLQYRSRSPSLCGFRSAYQDSHLFFSMKWFHLINIYFPPCVGLLELDYSYPRFNFTAGSALRRSGEKKKKTKQTII